MLQIRVPAPATGGSTLGAAAAGTGTPGPAGRLPVGQLRAWAVRGVGLCAERYHRTWLRLCASWFTPWPPLPSRATLGRLFKTFSLP